MDTFCQSPARTNTQRYITNMTNKSKIYLNILAETIKGFKGLTLKSTINDSEYYNSEEDVAKSNPKSDPLVSTHTSGRNERRITDTDNNKGNSPHKLLTNREIPAIIQGVIPPFNQTTADGVATSGNVLHVVRLVLFKDIVTGATHSSAVVLKDRLVLNWKDTGRTIPVERNTSGIPPRTTTQVCNGTGHSVPPIRIGSQKIEGPRWYIIP